MEPVQVPDADAFRAFQAQCEAERGWQSRYSREGVGVWVQPPPPAGPAVHTVKVSRGRQEARPGQGTRGVGGWEGAGAWRPP